MNTDMFSAIFTVAFCCVATATDAPLLNMYTKNECLARQNDLTKAAALDKRLNKSLAIESREFINSINALKPRKNYRQLSL